MEEHKDQETEGGGEVRIDRSALKDARLHARLEKMREELKRRQGVSYEGPDEFQQVMHLCVCPRWWCVCIFLSIIFFLLAPSSTTQKGRMTPHFHCQIDFAKALKWYEILADKGFPEAKVQVGAPSSVAPLAFMLPCLR